MSPSLKIRTLIGLTLVGIWAGTAQAQENLNWAEKMFNKRSHDFGVVARGADVSYRFKITNLYKETVHISNVRTTCGCSAASPTKTTLKSREAAYVEVTMDTRKFMREKDSNVIVTFDAPLREEVRIPIKAYIRTDVVMKPGGAKFGDVVLGKGAEKKIDVAYAGRNDWKIRDIRSKSKHLEAAIAETTRQGGRVNYQLTVRVKSSAPAGPFREQITLVTNDAKNPYVPVLVDGIVESDITVTPSVVSLGMMTPGKSKTVNVVLRGKKPFQIEKIECDSKSETFKIESPSDRKIVHVLPLTVVPPEKSGTLNEEFTVTIAGRPQPVTFKAYGKIATDKKASSKSETETR